MIQLLQQKVSLQNTAVNVTQKFYQPALDVLYFGIQETGFPRHIRGKGSFKLSSGGLLIWQNRLTALIFTGQLKINRAPVQCYLRKQQVSCLRCFIHIERMLMLVY